MRQRELFESAQLSVTSVPEAVETKLIELLAQLMLSTLNPTADEEESNEPDHC